MKIMFAALDVPYPTDRGQRMRTWSILRALKAEGHETTLVSFCASEEIGRDGGELARVCAHVDLIPAAPIGGGWAYRQYLGRLRGLLSSIPYGAWRFRSPLLQQRVHRKLREMQHDLVIWDETYNLENLVGPPLPVPVVLNSHDIVQIIWGRYLKVERQALKRAYAAFEFRKLRRWEAVAYRRADAVWAVSRHDADLLEQMCPGLPVIVVPNTVDVATYEVRTTDDGVGVLFIGGMDWFPNRDAVEFFARSVLPALRARVPAARFTVVGRLPEDGLRRLEAAGVGFVGRVEDIRPVVGAAAVTVVPLRIGSGTRLKILEAAALGKAMVSTRLGAEGLHFTDGTEIALADEPAAMAAAVAELLECPAARRAMGAAARRRVEQEYSIEALRASLRRALSQFEGESAPRRILV